MKNIVIIIGTITLLSGCCYAKPELSEQEIQEKMNHCEREYLVEYSGPFMPHIFGSVTDVVCTGDDSD